MVEGPETALSRLRTVLMLLIDALEQGIEQANDYFGSQGYRRAEHHGHLHALLAKAHAIEGPLRDAVEMRLLNLSRGPMESIRLVTDDGDELWVQRPDDGSVVHGSPTGVMRDAESDPERHFRQRNPVQLALNVDGDELGRLHHFVMLWHADTDLGLVCRLLAPYGHESDSHYWAVDFDLISLLALDRDVDPIEAGDLDIGLEGDDEGRGDTSGDLDLGQS